VSRYRSEAMPMIERGFFFVVSGYCPCDYASSTIDESGARAIRETTLSDRSASVRGDSVGWKRSRRSTPSATTSRRFKCGSNVTNASDVQLEKQDVHNTAPYAGI
jgi:hypothetical protein